MKFKNLFGGLASDLVAALGLSRSRATDIQQFSDRKFLRDIYLPAFAVGHKRILWVGCRKYKSSYYAVLEQEGAEVWTSDIEPRLARWGRKGRHRTGDICRADTLFSDLRFDAILCNGVLGYGVDSLAQQSEALSALGHILSPGGLLLLGWNTDKISDPLISGVTVTEFCPVSFAGYPSRQRFEDVTHVYDILARKA